MGHEDVSTTMIYVHHVPRHDAADKLSALLRRETEPLAVEPHRAIGQVRNLAGILSEKVELPCECPPHRSPTGP